MGFRSRMFELCNSLEKDPFKESVIQTLKEIEKNKDSEHGITIQGLIGSQRAQFLSYLLLDDDVDEIRNKDRAFSNLRHLSCTSRNMLELAHQICVCFVDECLEEIRLNHPSIAKVLDPYSIFVPLKKYNVTKQNCPIERTILRKYARSFTMIPEYKKIGSDDSWKIVISLPDDKLYQLILSTKQDLYDVEFGDIPNSFNDIRLKATTGTPELIHILSKQALLLLSLRETLELAVQMIYITLCGGNLVVLNNDNIIDINQEFSNVLYKGITVLAVGIKGWFFSELGGLVLMDCTTNSGRKIKEFGRIDSMTLKHSKYEGQTMRYNLRLVNEHLNPWIVN